MKVLVTAAFVVLAGAVHAEVLLSDDEIQQTLSFGPWPISFQSDPSNRVSSDTRAIALGAALFNDPVLSADSAFSCARCHDPEQAFTTSDARALGRVLLDRNTPSLRNLAGLRWYGWGGKSDSLWAASLHPIIEEQEMAHSKESLKTAISESTYINDFEAIFGDIQIQDPELVLVNTAKTLSAYLETLATGRTQFDDFRDALENQDLAAAANYPEAAQRGLQLFIGRGNCVFCHNGPRFSNNEFHDAGVPYFLSETEVDNGRFGGLNFLLSHAYTLDGSWSDDPEKQGAWVVRSVRRSHSDFGTFRTPSLRGVAETAPYMHDGSLIDLDAVIRHYSEIDTERLHADGEAILSELNLSEQEIADLAAFLESLSKSP
ncbi:cytochrome-c peroxidase [Ruegeria atlantica]|uniref:Methylamine utilization protein MauG n=1 Tax=Ruegeria atlantica TaxID=81569 RepID=A0A0P1E4E9_9RHOB|nr:cytochrome c peroxidase [Ruegeria atlantica]CUH43352.1 Methylamine utilization protein MauG precursor [Ruegeria atlantica]